MTPITLGRPLAALHSARERASLILLAAACGLMVTLAGLPHAELISNQFKPGNAGNLDQNIKKASAPLMDSMETVSIAVLPILVMAGVVAWMVGSRKGAEGIVKPVIAVIAIFSIPGIVA